MSSIISAFTRDVAACRATTAGREKYHDDLGGFGRDFYESPPNPLQLQVMAHNAQYDRTLVEAPVGHGKSWYGSYLDIIHTITFDRTVRGLYVTSSDSLAWDNTRRILGGFESPRLVATFGGFKSDQWSVKEFRVLGADPRHKEPSLFSVGMGSSIEGHRFNRVWIDDPINSETANSPACQRRFEFWWDNELLKRLEPGAIVRIYGSAWGPSDFFQYVAGQGDFHRLTLKALDENDNPLCPGRFTKEALIEERRIRPTSFALRFQQDRTALTGNAFKMEWLKYCDPGEVPAGIIRQAWDFNLSTKESADWTVCVTAMFAPDGNIYILDIYMVHLESGHVQAIVDKANQYNPQIIGVEANLFQRLIYQSLRANPANIRVVPITNRGEKGTRIRNLEAFYTTGRIIMVRGIPNMAAFIEQYMNFPFGKHDDILDALEMVVSLGHSGSSSTLVFSDPF